MIRRQNDDQEPNGVLEKTAAFPILAKLIGRVGEEGATTFIRAGAVLWARFGYTTTQDGRSMPGLLQSFNEVATHD
ncbi:MAG: hypothetical protein VYA84_05290 [Planctomycetota bacterium]|nr:hypothetical protein [Planctomycetota bacterium]